MKRLLHRHGRLLAVTLIAAAATIGPAGVAAAQYADPPPPAGAPADPGANTASQATANPADESGGLPVTGGDILGLVALGSGAVVAGAALVGVRRRAARP